MLLVEAGERGFAVLPAVVPPPEFFFDHMGDFVFAVGNEIEERDKANAADKNVPEEIKERHARKCLQRHTPVLSVNIEDVCPVFVIMAPRRREVHALRHQIASADDVADPVFCRVMEQRGINRVIGRHLAIRDRGIKERPL